VARSLVMAFSLDRKRPTSAEPLARRDYSSMGVGSVCGGLSGGFGGVTPVTTCRTLYSTDRKSIDGMSTEAHEADAAADTRSASPRACVTSHGGMKFLAESAADSIGTRSLEMPVPEGRSDAADMPPTAALPLPLPVLVPNPVLPPKTCVRDRTGNAAEPPIGRVDQAILDAAIDEYFNDEMPTPRSTPAGGGPPVAPAVGASPFKGAAAPGSKSTRGQVQLSNLNLRGRVPSFGRAKTPPPPKLASSYGLQG